MSKAQERGPNYNWEVEARHLQEECEHLRRLLYKVESLSEKNTHRLETELSQLSDAADLVLKLNAENKELKEALSSIADFKRDSRATTKEYWLKFSHEACAECIANDTLIARESLKTGERE